MTLLTKFAVTEELLNQREHLHDLVDMLWKNGDCRRSELYEAMQTRLNSSELVRISDMHPPQIRVVAGMFDLYVQHRYADCVHCKHRSGKNDIGLIRCALTGEPFCHRYKDTDKPLNACEDYERHK